ncbi:MAG: ATP-binding protein [Roseimicrobium sp.]
MTQTPTDNNQTDRELRSLTTLIEDWRVLEDISKAELLRRVPDLGSDKTYTKLVNGDTSELDVTEWLPRYRNTWDTINGAASQSPDEELYEDFHFVKRARKLFVDTAGTRTNARFGLILGASGTGKTSIRRVLESKYGARVICLEACEAWKGKNGRGSHLALMRGIVRACGRKPFPRRDTLQDQCIECLDQARVAVMLDEAYHLCPQGLDTTKTLLNNTRGEFFFFSLAALWDDMTSERDAYRAVKQLTGNRMAGVLRLKVHQADLALLVTRRLPELPEQLQAVLITDLAEHASRHGNYAFAREVIGRVRAKLTKGVKPSQELIRAEVRAELTNRGMTTI